MTEILVRLARDDADVEAARELCREWLDWHWDNYPAGWPTDPEHPMNPEKYQAILEALPERHKRPDGGILVAFVNGHPAGCVMYNKANPGVAEFNRMFVSAKGRGNGLGQKLLERMFEQMVADGYTRVFFSSATFLTHARAMYTNAGFIDMAQPGDLPDHWRDKVYFMERALV
jgi:GNAT superfamily N-acetyltransferase